MSDSKYKIYLLLEGQAPLECQCVTWEQHRDVRPWEYDDEGRVLAFFAGKTTITGTVKPMDGDGSSQIVFDQIVAELVPFSITVEAKGEHGAKSVMSCLRCEGISILSCGSMEFVCKKLLPWKIADPVSPPALEELFVRSYREIKEKVKAKLVQWVIAF